MPEPTPGKLSADSIRKLQDSGFIPRRKPTMQTQLIISCLTCPLRDSNEAYGYEVAGCTRLSPETVYPTLKRFRKSNALTDVNLKSSSSGAPQVVYMISPDFQAAVTNTQPLPKCVNQ
jgi:hypothetical protein